METRSKGGVSFTMVTMALGIALILAGCTGSRAVLETWVGAKRSRLVATWGVPDKAVRNPDGTETLEYEEETMLPLPTNLYEERRGVEIFRRGLWCFTRFTLSRDDRVQTFSEQGNHCRPVARAGRPSPGKLVTR